MFIGVSFGVVHILMLYLLLGMRFARSSVNDFWAVRSKSAEACLFKAYCRAGGPTAVGSSAFVGRGLLRIRSRRLGGRAVGWQRRWQTCVELVRVTRLMPSLPLSLSILLLLQFSSFVGVSSL